MFVIPKYRYCCPAKNQKSKVLPFLSYRKVLLSGYSFKKYSRKITLRAPFVPSPYFRLNFVLELDSSSVDWTFLVFLGSKTGPRRINRKKIGDRIEDQFTWRKNSSRPALDMIFLMCQINCYKVPLEETTVETDADWLC